MRRSLYVTLLVVTVLGLFPTVSAVSVESTTDAGQDAFKITTETATYYFHKQGAGFSSIVDNDDNDGI